MADGKKLERGKYIVWWQRHLYQNVLFESKWPIWRCYCDNITSHLSKLSTLFSHFTVIDGIFLLSWVFIIIFKLKILQSFISSFLSPFAKDQYALQISETGNSSIYHLSKILDQHILLCLETIVSSGFRLTICWKNIVTNTVRNC